MSSWTVDEPYGQVPMWVLDLRVSDRAIRLLAQLSAERDYGTDMAQLGRKLLASKLRCSLDSLDRAKAELEKIEAITVIRGNEPDSGQISRNVYRINRNRPGSRTPAATPIAAPVRLGGKGAARSPYRDESSSSSKRLPGTVAGKVVTAADHDVVDALLAKFNECAGAKFAGREWRVSIVRRMREHPDLSLDEHLALVARQFESPWWTGAPTPSVIWGNGRTFDRALNATAAAPEKPRSIYDRPDVEG